MAYAWFNIIPEDDFTLEQGDLILNCPIIIPPLKIQEGDKVDVEVNLMDIVILTQSCDLIHKKTEIILVCPYYTLDQFGQANDEYKNPKIKEKLRTGLIPSYHLINKCEIPKHENDYIIVDFRSVYGVHVSFLNAHVKTLGKRIRLLPPYREHLSQAFARYFMRVGLPIDIAKFK